MDQTKQAQNIDGKAIAAEIRAALKAEIEALDPSLRRPGLAVILVGDDPASSFYVARKQDSCTEVGIKSFKTVLPANASREEVIGTIEKYNVDDKVDGILLQLPLPEAIREHTQEILDHIRPEKDVDGLTSYNLGQLTVNSPLTVYPCTPKGCMELLGRSGVEISGKKALVIGRSTLVGKPIALMLNQANATVTMAHSRTEDISQELAQADIVVVAIGQPEMIKGADLKPGAVVIDVGINSVYVDEAGKMISVNPNSSTQTANVPEATKKRLVGDVDYQSCLEKASLITPVPGGVGPMTVASLLSNTLELYKRQ